MRFSALATPAFHSWPHSANRLSRLKKVLSINRFTGIETRSAIGNADHPIVNQLQPPSIKQLNEIFMHEGVRLSTNACKKALQEWGGSIDDITHVVSTTCTNSANPGYDHFVIKELGIRSSVEKVLLHGIGCSGGMAAMRTAANMALGASYRQKPARILVLACEISSVLVRSELESIHQNQEVRIGVCLFSDCASACVMSNGIGHEPQATTLYSLLGWKHEVLEDSHSDLGFDVDPLGKLFHAQCYHFPIIMLISLGWKVVLTPRVPSLASASVPTAFRDLINSIPSLSRGSTVPSAADFDWALHPGGSTIITGIQEVMNLTEDHLQASYEVYVEHGNSSSATIMSVMDRMRKNGQSRKNVVACAFGPGIILELMVLRRGSTAIDMLPTEDVD